MYWVGFGSAVFGALVITVYLFLGPTFASGGLSLRTLPLAVAVLVAAAFALLLAWTVGALVRTAVRATANREAQGAPRPRRPPSRSACASRATCTTSSRTRSRS